jgi:subtilisin family serine protease
MRLSGRLSMVIILACCLLWTSAAIAGSATRYVVVFKVDVAEREAAHIVAQAGGAIVKSFPQIGVAVAVSDNPNFAETLAGSDAVDSVSIEKSGRSEKRKPGKALASIPSPEDASYGLQWNIRRVKADKAWPITLGSDTTVVAVIDTGVAWNHPDLAPNVRFAACYSSQGSCTWYENPRNCPCSPYPDYDEHGTNVAGVIAAAFGGGELVGVGPNLGLASYNVYEFLTSANGEPVHEFLDSSVWDAMFDAVNRGFRVINFSSGLDVDRVNDIATITAWARVVKNIQDQGVVIVASAGNNGINLNGPDQHIPADLPGVIGVGMTGIRPEPLYPQDGSFDVLTAIPWTTCLSLDPASCTTEIVGSNFGAAVDLVAPGGDLGPGGMVVEYLSNPKESFAVIDERYMILTTDATPLAPACARMASCKTGYFRVIGTSFAAPHVAAAAALVIDRNVMLSPNAVNTILRSSAETIGPELYFGAGMLDVFSALAGQ